LRARSGKKSQHKCVNKVGIMLGDVPDADTAESETKLKPQLTLKFSTESGSELSAEVQTQLKG